MRTNNISEQSLTALKNQFELQQRAFVEVNVSKFANVKLDDLTKLQFSLGLDNIGKATAFNIQYHFVVETPAASEPPSFRYNTLHPAGISAPLFSGVPTQFFDVNQPMISSTDKARFQPIDISPDLREDFIEGKKYVVIFGQVHYDDYFGSWWTQFCAARAFPSERYVGGTINAKSCVPYNTEGGTPKSTK